MTKKIIVKHTQWSAQNVRMNEVKQNYETIVDETLYWRRWRPLKWKISQKKLWSITHSGVRKMFA